jgi:hypothetical protein
MSWPRRAEHLEELVPEGLRFRPLALDLLRFARKLDRAVSAQSIPRALNGAGRFDN